jgi:hypothetical protein
MKTTLLKPNENRLYGPSMVKGFVNDAIDRVGILGWGYLSRDMKQALLAQIALAVAIGNGRGDISCAAIQCLRMDMMVMAGLND